MKNLDTILYTSMFTYCYRLFTISGPTLLLFTYQTLLCEYFRTFLDVKDQSCQSL